MTRRFTVIQGGLPSEGPDRAETPEVAEEPVTGWRVGLHGPAAVDEAAVAAWRALLTRCAVADPLRDPDYLLTVARHDARERRIAVATAWSLGPGGRESLRGVVPLVMPHPVWGRRARAWRPAGPSAAVEPRHADAVAQAVRDRLAALPRPVLLDDESVLAAPSGPPQPRAAAPSRVVPADSLVGVRPRGYRRPSEVECVSEPERVRDAVEAFLALDARTARRAIVADPSEAASVRVISRLFARRRQMRVELSRRGGEVVAGTLYLGAGAGALAWRHAARA